MSEQIANHTIRRASATSEELAARRTPLPASRHCTGHYAGLHPEDAPYLSGTMQHTNVEDEVEEDETYYPQRRPSSVRRYTTTAGQQVIERGHQRMVIHHEPPPPIPKRHTHWLTVVGVALLLMVIGWIALTLLMSWWQTQQVAWQYGMPRTFQTDQVVGHADSAAHPTHFIAVNASGTIEVVELNPVHPKADHVYLITSIADASVPVRVSFADVNHDGKLDLLVTMGTASSSSTIVLLNDGTQFRQP